MKKQISGNVLVVGDSIDTDVIYPGRFLELTDPTEIGSHCFAGISESIAPNFERGGLVVAGRNFGCGSSREHAPIAIINMGASAVLAESFARIFYRNGINLGLPLVVCPGLQQKVSTGDSIQLDLKAGTVTLLKTGEVLPAQPLGDKAMEILSAGGIKPLMRKKLQSKK